VLVKGNGLSVSSPVMRVDVTLPKTLTILDSVRLAANDAQSLLHWGQSALAVTSQHDLYLSPHFDDICFSLGAFASRRRQGNLYFLLVANRALRTWLDLHD
jgi:hypothetical protein